MLDLLLVHVGEEVKEPLLNGSDAVESLKACPDRIANLTERLDERWTGEAVSRDRL